MVPQIFQKNPNFKVRFSGILIMIAKDFSDERNLFCVNFPIPAPLVAQKPENPRKCSKKVQKYRKASKKVGKPGVLHRFVGAVFRQF